jgi:8-oxo-dGTP pyrophosphatase MutT (NUDIX family)
MSELEELARAFASGDKTPAVPRDASTVVLLRDPGPEVYLLRRVRGMAFAGGMHVFPGGAVDESDADAEIRWEGPSAAQWGEWFRADERTARALVCAAVRETFEECGVLLAGDPDLLTDVSTDEWEAERLALESREQSLSQLLDRRGLVLRADLLRPLAHWITPDVEPKRFDTRFFLAEMPNGQICRDVGSEADERLWLRPADARPTPLQLMPPTLAAIKELAEFDDVASALAADREIVTVAPRLVVHDDGRVDFLLS